MRRIKADLLQVLHWREVEGLAKPDLKCPWGYAAMGSNLVQSKQNGIMGVHVVDGAMKVA